jgi:transcriptional antiterminator
MMQVNLTSKEKSLLNLFLKQEQPLPVKQITLALDVSDKTLRSMVRRINEELLSDRQVKIELKRGKGYVLAGGGIAEISQVVDEQAGTSEKAMEDQVFGFMIDAKDYVTMDRMCELLFVSKSKLNFILAELKGRIRPFGLTLESRPHYGMKIVGEELGKRLAITAVLDEGQYTAAEELKAVESIVVSQFQIHRIQCSDIMLQSLIYHLKIMLKRISQGHIVQLDRNEGYESSPDFSLTQAIFGGWSGR